MPRNALEQKGRVRGVDDASRTGSGVNLAAAAVEKLGLPTLDTNIGVIQHIRGCAASRPVRLGARRESSVPADSHSAEPPEVLGGSSP